MPQHLPTITMMDIGGWLRSLGLEQYEAAFHANAIDADVLSDLTDQDLQKLGVLLGDRRKLLRAIAALNEAFAPAGAPRSTPLPISPEAILAAAAAGASPARQEEEDYSVSASPPSSPVSSRNRSADKISDRFLPSPERTTLWPIASDDSDGDDIQTAETGEVHAKHDYHDDPETARWRYRLVMATAAIALAGLGVVSAFAYRAVSAGAVLPALPPIMKVEYAPNENLPNEGNNPPSDLSTTSIANAAGSSADFVSRFPVDNQEPPKTARISPDPSASPPSGPGSAVAPVATAPPAPPPSIAPPATSLPPKVAAPIPTPSSSTPKKTKSVISRSDGSGQIDISAATNKSPAAKPSGAMAPPAGNQLAPDAAATAPEAKQTAAAALPVGKPLSLAPDAYNHSAPSPLPRSHMPPGTATAAGASASGGYAVAVASERSAADADAVFRSLQAKFPNQLGGREPIVHRNDLGPEGTYYSASIGPFTSMKAAARVCSALKAAGESCLVEKN
jgi:SAM domain (Sterile alpha motif)/SPOR domain